MKIPEDLAKHIISKGYSERFDKTFYFDDKEYHYFVNNSIFFAQMCRVYSLLAKKLGLASIEYDYIRMDGKNLIYVPSINKSEEIVYESDILPDDNQVFRSYEDFINLWKDRMSQLPFKDKEAALKDFYKQCFFGLLIYDVDKQISLVKESNGFFRLGDYFDYGGVYMMQDQPEIDNDIFFDQNAFEAFCTERDCPGDYTEKNLLEDLDNAIQKNIINDIVWSQSQEQLLKSIIPYVDVDFIKQCLNVQIIDVLSDDDQHEYSDNFKKVIEIMFETSKKILLDHLQNILKDEIDTDYILGKQF